MLIAKVLGLEENLHVYMSVGGPNYETIAELRMIKLAGVDTARISTAHEVLTQYTVACRCLCSV